MRRTFKFAGAKFPIILALLFAATNALGQDARSTDPTRTATPGDS